MKRLTHQAAEQIAGEFSLMKFFPSDPGARVALVGVLLSMCQFEEQARWLPGRMFELYNEWPGPIEMRAVYCSKFPAFDRIEAYSQHYPNGIPSRDPARNLEIEGAAVVPSRELLELRDADCAALVRQVAGSIKRLK